MKLLTLNTHSLEEKNYEDKTKHFVDVITEIKPQIIALQEVNQSEAADEALSDSLMGYYPCKADITVRKDNHMVTITKALQERGLYYYWTWLPMKRAYDKYDEGIAIMSLSPICNTNIITISSIDDYSNWKTRKIIGIQTESTGNEWFFSVHYSWWIDEIEPFKPQWKKTEDALKNYEKVWLMGDFNNPAEVTGEGYDTMIKTRFQDSYQAALKKDSGITVKGIIDGWRDKLVNCEGMRIDQIWFTGEEKIKRSEVIFNGKNKEVVSDHYGLLIERD